MSTAAARAHPVATGALALRLGGAALLVATAGIHLYLWQDGYRSIHVIGPLFLLNAVGGAAAALGLLLAPARLLPMAAALGGLLELGTLGGLLVSTTVGLFGFTESWQAELVPQSVVVETTGALLLLGYAASAWWRGRRTVAGG